MSSSSPIPFNRPSLTGKETKYIEDAIKRCHASGDGFYTKSCHSFFEEKLGIKKALLTTSCTHALEMAAILCDVEEGDEVIVPSYTFTSTVNAFVLRGANPIFCDVRPDTLNLDDTKIERLVTSRTKVIVPVHYAGVACEMDSILKIAKKHGLYVVEDNAQGIFGKYKGRSLGSIGDLGTLSFHETKNINCGEGGALLINKAEMVQRAEVIREKGTNRSQFFRGEVDKYGWVDLGSSFLPSDILAAYLWAQLERWQSIQSKRREIWEGYQQNLTNWALNQGVRLPVIPAHVEQSFHLFYLILPSLEERSRFIAHLREQGIHAVFHYQALNSSPMGLKLGGRKGQCPISEKLSDQLVRLPLYNSMTEEEQWRVIDAVLAFQVRSSEKAKTESLAA
ncbi:MAG: dTDP-4-amino-4,6-dideoxygalactose transaminase [Proteobacteria bacterium]|nr:dTDP-4-amino-4,6-dideoxygalactose transaminase [Pseudomonadota bacterium]